MQIKLYNKKKHFGNFYDIKGREALFHKNIKIQQSDSRSAIINSLFLSYLCIIDLYYK